MRGIKKRQERLYTEECQKTTKQKISSRLTTVASLSFSQASGTLQLNSPNKKTEFFSSPRCGIGQQSYFTMDGHLQKIDSSLAIDSQVHKIDVQQLLQTIGMIKFYILNSSHQRRYINAKQQSNFQLRQKLQQKQYGVQQTKLKIQRKKASLQRKKHQEQLIRHKKHTLLNQDIFELALSIKKMRKKLSQPNNIQTVRNITSKQFNRPGRMMDTPHSTSNKYYAHIDTQKYNRQIVQFPSRKHPYQQNRLPLFVADTKLDCNKYIQQGILKGYSKEDNQFDQQYGRPSPNQYREGAAWHNKARDSVKSSKWENHDDEDQQLVELLSNSIKKLQCQPDTSPTKPAQLNKQQGYNRKQSNSRQHQILSFHEDSSSVVNITYESQDKRHSRSQDSKQETVDPIKDKIKKKQTININQSPVKIQLQISHSRTSSFRSDFSKTNGLFGKLQSCTQSKNNQINEESDDLASCSQHSSPKLRPSDIQNAKHSVSTNRNKLISLHAAETPLKKPPNLLEAGSLSQSIQMQYSQLSKQQNKISKKDLMHQSTAQSDQDILDSINLLHHSKISREKAKKKQEAESVQSRASPKRLKKEELILAQSNFAEEIGPLKMSSLVIRKNQGSGVNTMRNRSITAMNRLSVKNFNERVSLPIEQVEGEEDEKIPCV